MIAAGQNLTLNGTGAVVLIPIDEQGKELAPITVTLAAAVQQVSATALVPTTATWTQVIGFRVVSTAASVYFNWSGGTNNPSTAGYGQLLVAGKTITPTVEAVTNTPFDSAASAAVVVTLGTSATNNVATLNAALLTNSWVVISTPGTYTFNASILIPSNVRLTVNPGVILKLADNTNIDLIRNYGSDGVRSAASWGAGNTNITIDGGGKLDFNFANNNTTGGINTGTGAAYGGAGAITNWPGWGIGFYAVTNFVIRDLEIVGCPYTYAGSSAKYAVAMTSCTDGLLQKLKIDNKSDGIHCLGGCKRIYIRDIVGTTSDDLVSVCPADYASYIIAGTRADCENIHVENVAQLGDSTAVKFLGCSVGGTEYRVRNCSAKNIYAKPRKSTHPTVYVGGFDGCTLENVYGYMSPDTAMIEVNHDIGISTDAAIDLGVAAICRGLKIINPIRRENGSFSVGSAANREEYSGTKLGRMLTVYKQAKVIDIDIDGSTWLTSAGIEGAVIGGGVGGFEIDSIVTTWAGYVKNLRIRNVMLKDANAAGSRLVTANKGLCHDGTGWTGSVTLENCFVDGSTYGAYFDTGSTATYRVLVSGCTFKGVVRAFYLDVTANICVDNCYFDSSIDRIFHLATTNIVDIRWGSNNFVANNSASFWWSSNFATIVPKSVQYGRGQGYVSITALATYSVYEADVIHVTANSFTVTLRDAFPGKIVTVINSGAGTTTMASSSSGTFSTGTVAAGAKTTYVCTNYKDWQVMA